MLNKCWLIHSSIHPWPLRSYVSNIFTFPSPLFFKHNLPLNTPFWLSFYIYFFSFLPSNLNLHQNCLFLTVYSFLFNSWKLPLDFSKAQIFPRFSDLLFALWSLSASGPSSFQQYGSSTLPHQSTLLPWLLGHFISSCIHSLTHQFLCASVCWIKALESGVASTPGAFKHNSRFWFFPLSSTPIYWPTLINSFNPCLDVIFSGTSIYLFIFLSTVSFL